MFVKVLFYEAPVVKYDCIPYQEAVSEDEDEPVRTTDVSHVTVTVTSLEIVAGMFLIIVTLFNLTLQINSACHLQNKHVKYTWL